MLTPGRYVGVVIAEDDVPFEGRFAEAEELNALIQKKLGEVSANE